MTGNAHEVTAKISLNGKPWAGMHVVGFEGVEGLSQLFEFHVVLYTKDEIPLSDFGKTLNQDVTLKLEHEASTPAAARSVNGILGSFQLHEVITDSTADTVYAYMATIVPRAWYHTHQSNCRVFHRKTLGDVINDVLLDCGIMSAKDFELKLSPRTLGIMWIGGPRDDVDSSSGVREGFRVQYRETNWDFLCRIMEEYGLFYYFEHQWSGGNPSHRLVVCDSTAAYDKEPLPGLQPTSLRYRESVRPSTVILRDFNADTTLPVSVSSIGGGKPDLHLRDYPGGYRYDGNKDDGLDATMADLRLQQARATARLGEGASDCVEVTPCKVIANTLSSKGGEDFVVTRVVHGASQETPLTSYTQDRVHYANQFAVIPAGVTFRPVRVTPKPSVSGVQTAVVLGTGTENAPCIDANGRVQVRFHWDAEPANSTCWVRVSQIMAQRQGAERGAMWFPRENDEVIVDFIEGDPDQPIVTGCVFMPSTSDSVHYTPFDPIGTSDTINALEGDATAAVKGKTITVNNAYRNVLKDGANELTMVDDGQASSALLLRARDATNEDANLVTDADEHHAIAQNFYQDVGNVFRQHVGSGGLQQKVDGDQISTIGGNLEYTVKGAVKILSGAEQKVWRPPEVEEEEEEEQKKIPKEEDQDEYAKATADAAVAEAKASARGFKADGKATGLKVGVDVAALEVNAKAKLKLDLVCGASASIFTGLKFGWVTGVSMSIVLGDTHKVNTGLLLFQAKTHVWDISFNTFAVKIQHDTGLQIDKKEHGMIKTISDTKKSEAETKMLELVVEKVGIKLKKDGPDIQQADLVMKV